MDSCIILVRKHFWCTSTTRTLECKLGTKDFESNALGTMLIRRLSMVYWTSSHDTSPIHHWFARSHAAGSGISIPVDEWVFCRWHIHGQSSDGEVDVDFTEWFIRWWRQSSSGEFDRETNILPLNTSRINGRLIPDRRTQMMHSIFLKADSSQCL